MGQPTTPIGLEQDALGFAVAVENAGLAWQRCAAWFTMDGSNRMTRF